MAAPWILPLWSAGQLNSAAQASATFFTNIGLNSTPSWEHDKAAATHLSAKDCALVADLQADMVRKNPEAIAEAREKLSELEAAPAGFAFPPADDPLWKEAFPSVLKANGELAGVCPTDSEGEESDGGEDDLLNDGVPDESAYMSEGEGTPKRVIMCFMEESAALGTPFGGSDAQWASPEPPATVEQAPPPTRKRGRDTDAPPARKRSRAQDAPLALPALADEDAPAEASEEAEAQAPVPHAARKNRSGRRPAAAGGGRGAHKRWTPEDDAALIKAVSENRGSVNNRSTNGIKWMRIQKRATLEYPLLLRHLPADIEETGSKTLSKRWCQYVNPADQKNKARVWR